MRRGWRVIWAGVAAAVLAPPLPAADPVVLSPSTGWTLEFGEKSCAAIRSFGSGAEAVTLAVLPSPGLESTTLGLVSERRPKLWQRMRVGLSNRPDPIDTDLWVDPVGKAGRWMISTFTPIALSDLDGANRISFTMDRDPPITLAVGNMAALLKAIRDCDADLMQQWGIGRPDPVLAGATAPGPAAADGDPGAWLTSDDYPPRAVIDRQQGMVVVTWIIDVDGRVRQCHVTRTSGWPLLDDAACQAMIKRGRFTPRRNEAGEAIRSLGSRRVIWRLPG
ncbi:energy transducer TonB [Sphingomonas sp. CJ99]